MADLPETDGKTLVDLYDMLKPIAEPPPIPMWPATQGWIWLGLALAALLAWTLWIARRRWRANAYRRAALAELDAAGDDPAAIAAILRRAALAAYPRREVAGLLGEDWLRFLDRTCPGASFASGRGRVLTLAPYDAQPPAPELSALARKWLKRHRAELPA